MTDLGYNIHFGNVRRELSAFFKLNSFAKIGVIVDENTFTHCYSILEDTIPKHLLIQIKSGESNKNLSTCEFVLNELSVNRFDRKSLIINLGGGVIGDLGGFCASIFKRGIEFINIPTTLLSQVDASVGGKTGVDFNGLKNEIGVFSKPRAVFADPIFYKTLAKRELNSGLAEMLKHSLLKDKFYFEDLKKADPLNDSFLFRLEKSVEVKADIVSQDFREIGIRKTLNFGHTIGHAIESFYLNSESPYTHGEAVCIGMICELFLSSKLSSFPIDSMNEIVKYITEKFNILRIDKESYELIIGIIVHDKKNVGNSINCVLLEDFGKPKIDINIDNKSIYEAFDFYNTVCN